MTDESDTSPSQGYTKLLTAEDAAAAAVAQSVSLAAQNEVDAIRNQDTVNLVAMGSAYAKWLQNPMLGNEFSAIVDSTKAKPADLFTIKTKMQSPPATQEKAAASHKQTDKRSLSSKIFDHFLSDPNTP